MGWTWLDWGFAAIAKHHNQLLEKLLQQRQIRLTFLHSELDCVDISAANLIGAALARQHSLSLTLPDNEPRRAAFLFAYALIAHWWRTRDLKASFARPVLYCGVDTGIREQLSHVGLVGIRGTLDEVFAQTHLLRRGEAISLCGGEGELPRVITAYAPADPAGLIETLNPAWIAIDISDAARVPWVEELLAAAHRRDVIVLAWGRNQLSEAVHTLKSQCYSVKWPLARAFDKPLKYPLAEKCEFIFHPYIITDITPIIPNGESTNVYNSALAEASEKLQALPRAQDGSLLHSAIQQHWRLLRSLENLSVPYTFHEAEAGNFWGLSPIERLEANCTNLSAAVARFDSGAGRLLEDAHHALKHAIGSVKDGDPPMWGALITLLHQEAPAGYARLIVFPGTSRKELFTLALLAKLNITAPDLESLRNWIVTLGDVEYLEVPRNPERLFDTEIPLDLAVRPTFVGLPSTLMIPRLLPLLLATDTDFLIHAYQVSTLRHRMRTLDMEISPNIADIENAIAELAPLPPDSHAPHLQPRVVMLHAASLNLTEGQVKLTKAGTESSLWRASTEADEIGRLFDVDEEEPIARDESPEEYTGAAIHAGYVNEAIEITFEGNWRGLFDFSQRLNVVAAAGIEERYVRALKPHDTVLLIPNQSRQSLYDLVINRVHQHRAMQLTLALLRRWHEDLRTGFRRWQDQSERDGKLYGRRATELFLAELQSRGSHIRSELAIRFWINATTLAPTDREDIRRAADLLNLGFCKENYARIDAAASRIRGLHRGLSNRLGHWLVERARGVEDSQDAEVIDSQLGLTFGDLRRSIIITTITKIMEAKGVFDRNTLGRIERGR